MNPRRVLLALVVALVLSGAVTFVISRKLSPRGAPHPNLQRYVAASRSLQAGEMLKPDDLVLTDWPASVPLPNAFTRIGDVAGRAVIYPVAAAEPILEGYLAAPGSGIGLSTKIPEGMRATSVKSDEVVGVAGFLFPGSHVDVLVTFRSDRLPTPETQIVLQDVEVLTIGQKVEPDPNGKPEPVNVVTLLLTPEDAQKLMLASTQGGIQFVLRNGADHTKVQARPVQMAQLSGTSEATSPAPAAEVTPRPHLPIKEPYVVETILGDKRSSKSFE
jgi:pilus assembly protein CpaB